MNNMYWRNIEKIADDQRAKGLINYGCGLEDNDELNIEDTIRYLQEELVDALMYCEHIKARLEKKRSIDLINIRRCR